MSVCIATVVFILGMHYFSVCGISSVKVIVGKFFTGGVLEEINSLASLVFVVVDAEVLVVVFFFIGGGLCHRGSERLSSLSDVPCQLSSFSSLRPRELRGLRDFTSSGMNPPLYCFRSGFLFILVCLCMKMRKFVIFLKQSGEFVLSLSFATELTNLQNDLSRIYFVLEFSVDRLRNCLKNADPNQVLKC